MNELHRLLDALVPFVDFGDSRTQEVWLRALPFTAVAIYFGMNVYTILLRAIMGVFDWYVLSQIFVKTGLIAWIGMLILNYGFHATAPLWMYDLSRLWLLLGAFFGIYPTYRYARRATHDLLWWLATKKHECSQRRVTE